MIFLIPEIWIVIQFHIMKISHDTKSPTRAIRVPAEIHQAAKVLAASEGLALSALATHALEQELIRRQPPSRKARPQS